jgi:hypothetical protein
MTSIHVWIARYLKAMIVPGFLLYFAGTYFAVINPLAPMTVDTINSRIVAIFTTLLVSPLTLIIGFVVMRKQPDSIIGTGIVLWGFAVAIYLSMPYGSVLFTGVGLPYMMISSFPGLFLMLASFPTGRIITPLWERVMYTLVFFMIVSSVIANFTALASLPADSPRSLTVETMPPLVGTMFNLTTLLFAFTLIVSFALLLYRYRVSGALERKQIRWLTLLGIYVCVTTVIDVGFKSVESEFYARVINPVFGPLNVIVLSYMPGIAIGMAILRHHLFDIDIIIRRTLIYSVLSGLLAVVFFGGVTLVQAVFRSATGEGSDLAIVISTLVIAALFNPLRRRVQNTIDRRFFRRKYDAERMLAQFAAVARDEVDVEKLKAALVSAVEETVQPKGVGVWIKE